MEAYSAISALYNNKDKSNALWMLDIRILYYHNVSLTVNYL